ncbi:hypothetical protein M9H77_16664 [Catharanthus roseus]|uniref:Uncharacterized protein n=1 Tax=Catharanthus roseus TaxID=4058 RepID=A0ACC0B2D1_CATRO|nr:hypothetical protein M9H77_16664 [Catharanthus roseus]
MYLPKSFSANESHDVIDLEVLSAIRYGGGGIIEGISSGGSWCSSSILSIGIITLFVVSNLRACVPGEVEVTSEPSLEPSQEPETNEKLVTPSSSIPYPPSVLETRDTELEGSDEEEEHPEAQAQALRDYQDPFDLAVIFYGRHLDVARCLSPLLSVASVSALVSSQAEQTLRR